MSCATHRGFNRPRLLPCMRGTARPSRVFVGTLASRHAPSFQSRVVAVGQADSCKASPLLASLPPTPFGRPSLAFGVSQSPDDPDTIPSVRCPDMTGTHHARPSFVARRLQVTEYGICA